jgi:hypothetical protein
VTPPTPHAVPSSPDPEERRPGRTTFVVGRRTAATSEVHWVRPDPSVFPGPWDLRAVVRRGPPSRRGRREGPSS